MGQLVRISALASSVRLDTTSVSSDADVNEEGLLQWGHSKDRRPDLPQINSALATLDPFGVPLASEVLSGEKADDSVSVPLIDRVPQGLARAGLLDVGDGNMAAEETRAPIRAQGDCYLCPLAALPVPPATLAQNVEASLAAGSGADRSGRSLSRCIPGNSRFSLFAAFLLLSLLTSPMIHHCGLSLQRTVSISFSISSIQQTICEARKTAVLPGSSCIRFSGDPSFLTKKSFPAERGPGDKSSHGCIGAALTRFSAHPAFSFPSTPGARQRWLPACGRQAAACRECCARGFSPSFR